MLALLMNLGFAGSGVPDAPTVPTAARTVYVQRTSPASFATKWRTVGWIRLRPAWAVQPC